MTSEISQKTAWLCLVGWLVVALLSARAMVSSIGARCAPGTVHDVIETSSGPIAVDVAPPPAAPAAEKAAPVPPHPSDERDEGIDESPQKDPVVDSSV